MYQTLILVMLSGLVATYLTYASEQRAQIVPATAAILALNFSLYRSAVISYVQANPNAAFAGKVPNNVLPAIGAFVPDPLWRNYVLGNTVVVYAASAPSVDITADLEQEADYSVFAGVVYNGTVVADGSALTPSSVVLPAAVAARVSNGLPVWEALNVF